MCLAPRRRLARTREAGVGLGSSMPASIGGYSSGAARSLLNSSAPALRKSDRCGVMTYPSAARDAAGSRTAPRPKVPKRSRRRPHASTVPGTVTVRMPRSGISSWPRDRTASMVASSPERPAPISPTGAVAPAGQTIAIRSPPIDVMCGYTTQRTAFAAITASTALPPSRSTCAPTSDAVLCGVAMTPLVTDGIIYRHLGSAFLANVLQRFLCQSEPFLLCRRPQGRPFLHRAAIDNMGHGDAGLYQLSDPIGSELDDQVITDVHGEDLVVDAERVRVHALRPSGMSRFGDQADIERLGQRLEWICHPNI